ncbi:50S ribosomal protein L3 [bacterium]|nr:MAG: 50S ribosomal protein L3 [bacterium]
MKGILGKKIGMTHIFNDAGDMVSVTVIEAGPCPVLTIKDKSVQVGFDVVKKEGALKKPISGFFKKINVPAQKVIRELIKDPAKEYKVGEELKVDMFTSGDFVDVTGTSIGKGFQGGMKRWHWAGGPMTHGSTSHRRIGSIGSATTPGRVFKGHHLPGHMGNIQVTAQSLKVAKVDAQNNLLMVEGAVPGYKNNYLIIKQAKKKKKAIGAKPTATPKATTAKKK